MQRGERGGAQRSPRAMECNTLASRFAQRRKTRSRRSKSCETLAPRTRGSAEFHGDARPNTQTQPVRKSAEQVATRRRQIYIHPRNGKP